MTTATLPSRTSSQQYTVTLGDDGSAACTCTAGQYGRRRRHVTAMRAEAARRNAAELADVTAALAGKEGVRVGLPHGRPAAGRVGREARRAPRGGVQERNKR